MKKRLRINPLAEIPDAPIPGVTAPKPRTAIDELAEGPPQTVAVAVQGYGGVSVYNARTPTEAMLRILDLLVRHRWAVDDTLVEYAVLLVQLPQQPPGGFALRREPDGWTLSVPAATTRDEAMLQVVQALLALARSPFGATLRAEGISPYRE